MLESRSVVTSGPVRNRAGTWMRGMGLAAAAGMVLGLKERDRIYDSAIAWALGGVAVERRKQPAVILAASAAIGVMALGLLAGLRRR